MAQTSDSDRIVDILLGVAAALLVGFRMYLETQVAEAAPPDVSAKVVAAAEATGIMLDADRALPPAERKAIGLTGNPDADPKKVVADLHDELKRDYADSRALKIVWSAIALRHRMDLEARAELDALADDARAKPLAAVIDGLKDLANGRATNLEPVSKGLRALGTSRWLDAALKEREAANRGAEAERSAADQEALDVATTIADANAATNLVTLGLVVLGLLAFAAVPFVLRSRKLRMWGHLGLVSQSPFRLERTRRVMFAWFVAWQYALFSLSILLAPWIGDGTDPTVQVLFAMLGSAITVALALAIVRAFGRKPESKTPLHLELGATLKTLPGRWQGLVAWSLPALGMLAVAIFVSSEISVRLFGPPDSQQQTILAVREGHDAAVMLIASLGAAVLAPIGEEMLFRGFLFRNLRDTLGQWPAVVLSGFIFAAVHMIPTLLLPLAAMGMVLALLYQWTNSLLVPITAHALWNLLTLISTHFGSTT